MTPLRLAYSSVLGILALGYLPVFVWRKVRRGGQPLALAQRLGFVPLRPGPLRFWVHAVSVGEVTAAVPLVRGLRARWPDTAVVVSTVTGTGARVARDRLRESEATFVLPLDLAHVARRAVARVRPRCFLALETELWPNLFLSLDEAGIPVGVVNGRISDRSFRRYCRVRGLIRRVLGRVALFAMQSEEDARRIVALGAPGERVVVTGNLKMDAPRPDPSLAATWRTRLGLGPEELVWVAGSTHPGEETAVLDAFAAVRGQFPRLRLVLAPRHPERAAEVEGLARARGIEPVRRSRLGAAPPGAVVLLDTVGELAGLYGVADVVFVGGSLVPVGGHNAIEPAAWGRVTVFGPHMHNFREAARALEEAGGALRLGGPAELAPTVAALLGDPGGRAVRGAAARATVEAHRGACERTLAALARILEAGRAGAPPG